MLAGSFIVAGFGMAASAWAQSYDWRLPAWMSPPPVPDGNAMTDVKVALGRRLFYDIRLSGPGYMACASCHKQSLAFTDGRRVAIGVTGERHTRNTPGLANVGFLKSLGWANPKREPLEVQLRRPMFGEEPIEMGTRGHEVPVLEHVRANSVYQGLFARAFPGHRPRISFETIGLAIAAFERTIVSGRSAYDRFVREGRQGALSAEAKQGLALFKSERLKCAVCHPPPFFTDAGEVARFHNTGLYNADGEGSLPGRDQGLANETGKAGDRGRFRAPSLRNVAVTAPYMHDGSIKTLGEVVDHYAAGGRAALKGAPSPLRSPLIRGFQLSAAERNSLVAFLESLTDETFLTNPELSTPYR